MRLLLVYGYEPSGHASAARALEAACRLKGIDAICVNISDYHSILGPAIARTYLQLIQRLPGLWTALYDSDWVAQIAQHWQKLYLGLQGGRLAAKLSELAPDLIVCTHAPPLAVLGLEKEKGRFSWPLAAVITDFEVHGYWTAPKADIYLAASQRTARRVVERGIEAERVRVTGIPINPAFEELPGRDAARKRLNLPLDRPLILVCGGSRGLGQLEEMSRALLEGLANISVAVVCGDNRTLLRSMREGFPAQRRLEIFGCVAPAKMRELMCAADLLVGKAGGLTTAEALAIGLPLLYFEPIPGQESRNADFLCSEGAAALAPDLESLARLAGEIISTGRRAEMSRKAKALGHPDSARRALDEILALVPESSHQP
ncbi:MAG: hypothetical protein HY549_08580 [Elusimicrobia bacterium]|nr:hypothetical protein [Elusimicrobiota bacterium]